MRIGVDLGGTKIEAVLLDAQGQVVTRQRTATPRGDYVGTLREIERLVARLEALAERRNLPVGIGTPGAWVPANRAMKNCNSTWLNGRPLKDDLEQRLGRTCALANDADCFALSEAVSGAGVGGEIVFGVILGTGVGGGLVVHGRLLQGQSGLVGEWGHVPLPYLRSDRQLSPPLAALETDLGDVACYCGRQNCTELFLNGAGLVRCHSLVSGDSLEPDEIAGLAPTPTSLQLYFHQLARSLAQVVNIVDPDVIVLGGGLSNISALYEVVPGLLPLYVFSGEWHGRLVRAQHGDSSGVLGAAWLTGPDGFPTEKGVSNEQ